MARKSTWSPFIQRGSIIKDPVLIATPFQTPRLVYIPLSICKLIDDSIPCNMFWEPEAEIPPLPLKLILALINKEDLPFPGQSAVFHIAIKEANHGIAILKKPTSFHSPGYFEK